MSIKVENDLGSININKEVIANIAGSSAVECYGLVGMATRSTTSGIVNLLKKENLSKGVKIEETDEGLIIDLYVIIQFGTKISVVAENIIEKVRYNVENQSGLQVKKVNVNIEGVKVQE
ncbi:MAG: Asp23/Gls24 family envelope stress response protein [Clostridiales bacterium]|nr:Asp23/Gls24 family envelope stress response protein [Clostridiales bacterium]